MPETMFSKRRTVVCLITLLIGYLIMRFVTNNVVGITQMKLVHDRINGVNESKWTPVQPDLAVTNGHSVTLTIHMAANTELINSLYCIALRSAALFWSPKLGKIGLIFDAESKRDHEFAAQLKAQEQLLGLSFDMMYQPLPPSGLEYFTSLEHVPSKSAGYNRQLWNSFFIDEYVTTSVVAWTDNDVLFATPVTPENIFNGNKIRTFGKYIGPPSKSYQIITMVALGKKMVAEFTCFPLFMWRDTITNCRNYILKHLNVTRFEDAFVKFRGPFSCPVNILYTYAFYFEHDRYDWHIRLPGDLQLYNKQYISPGFALKPSDLKPEVCVTMHKPYYDPQRIISPLPGYCTSMHYLDKQPKNCREFQNKTYFQVLESRRYFKRNIPRWCEGREAREACVKVSDAHYKNVAKHIREAGLFDLDLKRISDVEQAANEMKITCRKMDGLY